MLDEIIEQQEDNYMYLQLLRLRDHHIALKRNYFPMSIGDTIKDWVESGYAKTFRENWQTAPEFYDNIVKYLREEQDYWMLSEFGRAIMGNYLSKEKFFESYQDE